MASEENFDESITQISVNLSYQNLFIVTEWAQFGHRANWETWELVQLIDLNGAPDRIRTYDLCLRRATLYPAELRVRNEWRIIRGRLQELQ